MLVEATKEPLSRRILLFYSNHAPEDTAFLEELRALAAGNPQFTFVATMTQMGQSHDGWAGETGYVTRDMLERYIDDLTVPIYYCSGPAALVSAMRKLLTEAGVNEDNIRTEEFVGY
jgi:ferredoxin-NADP reductase